jgi:hypothetical protein
MDLAPKAGVGAIALSRVAIVLSYESFPKVGGPQSAGANVQMATLDCELSGLKAAQRIVSLS